MVLLVAMKVMGVVITSSPGPILWANKLRWSAAVQLVTPTQYLVPKYVANISSKVLTSLPVVRKASLSTFCTLAISFLETLCLKNSTFTVVKPF